MQEASYFAERRPMELDGVGDEFDTDRRALPGSGKRTESLEADVVFVTD